MSTFVTCYFASHCPSPLSHWRCLELKSFTFGPMFSDGEASLRQGWQSGFLCVLCLTSRDGLGFSVEMQCQALSTGKRIMEMFDKGTGSKGGVVDSMHIAAWPWRLYHSRWNIGYFLKKQKHGERTKVWRRRWGVERHLTDFPGLTMLAANICSWYSMLARISTPWQSPRKCKQLWNLGKEKSLLLIIWMWEML